MRIKLYMFLIRKKKKVWFFFFAFVFVLSRWKLLLNNYLVCGRKHTRSNQAVQKGKQ